MNMIPYSNIILPLYLDIFHVQGILMAFFIVVEASIAQANTSAKQPAMLNPTPCTYTGYLHQGFKEKP